MPTDWHLVHLGSRAIGGAGLIFTEMTDVGAGAHHARLHRPLQRRAGSRLEAHRRFRARQLGGEVLPAARPRRPQGRDQADVGGHGPAARRGRLADHLGLAAALLSAQPGAARDDARRHGPGHRRLRAGGRARRARRLRHGRAALRARLSAGELHLAADQPAHRRIWRQPREPPALPARGVPRHARGLAGREADVGAHLGDRLGRRAASPGDDAVEVARAFAEAPAAT